MPTTPPIPHFPTLIGWDFFAYFTNITNELRSTPLEHPFTRNPAFSAIPPEFPSLLSVCLLNVQEAESSKNNELKIKVCMWIFPGNRD